MAKWVTKKVNTLSGAIDYTDNESRWRVEQDEQPYVDMVKDERETHSNKHTHMKKFCTIPDIVAMELLTKHGLDVHSPTFMHDTDAMKKLKSIIIMEYPHLVVST